MSDGVWISSFKEDYRLGNKLGLREKRFCSDGTPDSYDYPRVSEEHLAAVNRGSRGFALERSEFPEAAAVWKEASFKKAKDIFAVGGFWVVKGKLAEVLARFDLGKGGLIPFPIYRADLTTPYPVEHFLLNFGAIKNTILPEQSENVVKFVVDKDTGQQIWEVNSWHEDDNVVLSLNALAGPDLWLEEHVYSKIFMSDALAQAIAGIGMAEVFRLKRCLILGVGA